jgi:hypothetical protein
MDFRTVSRTGFTTGFQIAFSKLVSKVVFDCVFSFCNWELEPGGGVAGSRTNLPYSVATVK